MTRSVIGKIVSTGSDINVEDLSWLAMMEENFRRAVIMDGYGAFFRDKLALFVLLLAFLSFVYPLYKQWRERKKTS